MKTEELKEFVGKFGLLLYDVQSKLKQLHGKIKDVDDFDNVAFKTTVGKLIMIKSDTIQSFEPKEALPEVKEHRGRDVVWKGGELVYKDNKKDVNIKR